MQRTSETPQPLTVRPKTAEQLLGLSHRTIYMLLNSGELQSFKQGKSRLITRSSIDRYIARRLKSESGAPPTQPHAA